MFRTLLISTCIICSAVSADTPVLYEDYKLVASDGGTYDKFGYSVCISSDGSTAIVGAYYDDDHGDDSGSAYIYELVGGVWEETKLLASDGASQDYFGESVSISGDGATAIVGACLDDDHGANSGSAYIYELVGGVWQETKLLASDGAEYDFFGRGVSISSDGATAIVGAHYDDDHGANSGSAYIYELVGGVWQETKLLASDGASEDLFGICVSLSSDGKAAIVGAWGDNDNGSFSGSAYIFELVDGVWEETKILASNGASDDHFGESVSISGDGTTALVGAPRDEDHGANSGSAYIYELVSGVWQETKLLASDGASGDLFGRSVSISSNGATALVGADYDNDNGSSSGSAYIYKLFDGSWIETKLLASDGASENLFGRSVSISGDGATAIVGAHHDDDHGPNSGSAYIFYVGDSDGDGVDDSIDNCYLYNPDQADCNENGIGDVCDIADGTSYNCDAKQGNTVPDECQPDCDGDGFIDPCDNEGDCNEDGIPDNCETDCNENNYPDVCDIMYGISQDINNDGIPDECQDCNKNGIPDPVDIADGTSEDADGNGIPDECQYPVTWTVDDDGKADFDNIQAAIDAASSLPNHDDILVYPGTYPAGIDMLGKEIWLHSSDGPEVTIIDGEETQNGIVCQSGETNDTVIEGFTISNCYGEYYDGGGMGINNESSATVLNCIFDSNVIEGNGGGVSVFGSSSVNISGCLFVNNRTYIDIFPGGGIGIYSPGGNVVITDTRFCDNWPNAIMGEWTDGGGNCIAFSCNDSDGDGVPDECGTVDDGVHYVPEEFATIKEAILVAGDHDEIIIGPGTYSECELYYPDSQFEVILDPRGKRLWIHSSDGPEKTIIDGSCPGIWAMSGETPETIIEGFTFAGGDWFSARLFLSNCTFKNCTFTGDFGFYARGLSPTFESCSFIDITTTTALSFVDYYGSPKVYNCTFKNNCQASIQGSVNYDEGVESTIEIINCLFEDNGDYDLVCGGGPEATVYISNYNSEIINCVFRHNKTQGGQGGVTLETWQSGNLSMSNCLFENNSSEYSLYFYPQVTQVHLGTIHASEFKNNSGTGIGSFLLGATMIIEDCLIKENSLGGIDSYGICANMTLIDTVVCSNGSYQICDGWIDGGGNSIAEVCFDDCQASDITDDDIVDVSDILAILGYWGSSIPAGDVDGNGVVDIGDLLMVVGNWGPCE